VIQHLGEKSIQTIRDNADVLRHIIKNVSSRLVGIIQSPACHEMGTFFFSKKDLKKERWTGATEPAKDTEDTTIVQIEEVERVIRALSFVTKLSPVGARNSHGHGYQVCLRCPSCEEYGSCGKKQEFGDVGNGTSCEKQINLDHRKCEDYQDTRFCNKDSVLVIKR
jgi:hypothetical protein